MNLILDPLTHAPHLKFLIKNSLYYTENKNSSYPPGHYSLEEFKSIYKFNFQDEKEKINEKKEFIHLFIVIPILSLTKEHEGEKYIQWVEKFLSLYNIYKNLITGKIIFFDNHGYNYDPNFITNIIKPDIILKRVFLNQKYNFKNIFSYPFIMCTINDPFYKLLNNEILPLVIKKNKIIWSGSLFKHHENINNICEEFTDRKETFTRFNKKYKNIIENKKVPYNQFLSLLNSYKYSLDLRGCSRLNKRLFEIVSTNSLLIAEKINVIWPFEEGDNFSPECFFEQGNIDDLYRVYTSFENDNELYKKCLNNQKYIVKKYFNKEWLQNYINNIIN